MEKLPSSLQSPISKKPASGEATQDSQGHNSSTAPQPSLDRLPIELQQLILSKAPNFQSLSALIHASPDLHRVYVADRAPILRLVLAQVLGGILVDAVGAYHSGTPSFQQTRHKSQLWTFIEEHEAKYTANKDWTEELSADEIMHLVHFHTSVIEPLTEQYTSWALASLPSAPTKAQSSQSLSDTEMRRIQRAMYRLQIFCHVSGSLGEGRSHPERIGGDLDRLRVLSIFPAWEVQEILCIHEFAKVKYISIFREVAWDLNEERNPKYKDIDMGCENEDLLLVSDHGTEEGCINYPSLSAVLRHGLQLLANTFKAEDHEQLVEMMRVAIVSGMGEHREHASYGVLGGWLDDAASHSEQRKRRDEHYSHRDSAQDTRQKMPFDGDSLTSPSLAWVLFWKGEYSNLFGSFVPGALTRWGFVMWDAARLDSEARDAVEWEMTRIECQTGDAREDDYVSDLESEYDD